MIKQKKHTQLGMNPSTANGKLLKDILWNLIIKTNQHFCCKCSIEMSRENFSIEHIIPWLDSEDPIKLFFDLNNISFSHLSCNVKDARKYPKYRSEKERKLLENERRRKLWSKLSKEKQQDRRRKKYLLHGK